MDPITLAIILALTEGVSSGLAEVAGQQIYEAFRDLKQALKQKYGEKGKLAQAVEKIEGDPKSSSNQHELSAQIHRTKADQDMDLQEKASLLRQLVEDYRYGKITINQQDPVKSPIVVGSGNTITYNSDAPSPIESQKLQEIAAGLADQISSVRQSAAEKILALPRDVVSNEPILLQLLRRCLDDEVDPVCRYWLACALGRIGGGEAKRILQNRLAHETDGWARKGIVEGLRITDQKA